MEKEIVNEKYCVSCGAIITNEKFKYCFYCNQNKEKIQCEGWFDKKCENKTVNQIHRCIYHAISFCADNLIENTKSDKRKVISEHLKNKCCNPKNCKRCKAPLFITKYNYCMRCNEEMKKQKEENKECLSCYNEFKTKYQKNKYCLKCKKNADLHKCQEDKCKNQTILQFCKIHYE